MKIIVQKTAILLVCLLLGISGLLAQNKLKFSIASFEADPFDASAKDPRYEKIDGNGDRYAIIKVTSNNPDDDLNEYQFNFGNLRSSTIMKDDVLWVYVQKNAKLVTISRSGYTTVNRYDLRTTIEAGKNYVMSLTSAEKRVMTQMVQFNIEPADSRAVVMVKSSVSGATEELFGNADASGAVARSLEYGIYTYKVFAKNYNTSEGRLTINEKDRTHVEQVVLVPNFSVMTLRVDADAEIYVNGELKATRQWAGPLRAGNYQVECRQANHTPSSQYITVVENDNRTIDLAAPTPIVGTVAITSNPLGADITIDGKAYGKTPKNIDIVIGNHTATISKPDYKLETQSFTIAENRTSDISVVLERIAKMTISSKPQGANLYIDGNNMGRTPYTADMASGDYTVKLTYPQYRDFEKRVHLDSSQPDVTYSLQRQYQQRKAFYIGAFGQDGMANGLGAVIGGYVNNFNIEANFTYYLLNEEVYSNTSYQSIQESITAYSYGIKLGYGIITGPKLRITPQIGVGMLQMSGDDSIASDNYYMSVGARVEYALSDHVGLSATPEGLFTVCKDDAATALSDVSSKIKNMLDGVSLKIGIYYNF